MFWNWTVMFVVQPREHTETHSFVHFKRVDFMACELCLKKKDASKGCLKEVGHLVLLSTSVCVRVMY